MLDFDTKKTYGITSAILAWLVFFSTVTMLALSGIAADACDTPDEASTFSRLMAAVLITAFFTLLRLLWWLCNPTPDAPRKISAGAYRLSRTLQFLLYLSLLVSCLCTLSYSFAKQQAVSVLGLWQIPVFVDVPLPLATMAQTVGTLFFAAMLLIYCLVFFYHGKRYKMGLRRMLPGLHL